MGDMIDLGDGYYVRRDRIVAIIPKGHDRVVVYHDDPSTPDVEVSVATARRVCRQLQDQPRGDSSHDRLDMLVIRIAELGGDIRALERRVAELAALMEKEAGE